ncbi:hypothetical protein ACB092_05G146400 [Castanea dentata]
MTSLKYMFLTAVWLLYYCLVLRVRFNNPKSAPNRSSVSFPTYESDENDLSNEDVVLYRWLSLKTSVLPQAQSQILRKSSLRSSLKLQEKTWYRRNLLFIEEQISGLENDFGGSWSLGGLDLKRPFIFLVVNTQH